jgi:hypothetical protein
LVDRKELEKLKEENKEYKKILKSSSKAPKSEYDRLYSQMAKMFKQAGITGHEHLTVKV